MDTTGRIVAVLITVILIFISPLQYIAQNQGDVSSHIINYSTRQFTDTARQQGYFTLDEYNELLDDLVSTGEHYAVDIQVSQTVSGVNTASSINTELVHDHLHEDIKETLILPTLSSMKENNKAQDTGISLLAAHTHTASCYVGHNHAASGCTYHTHSGSSSSYGGCYTVRVDTPYSYTCGTCGGSGRRSCPGGSTRTGSQYYANGETYCSVDKGYPSANVSWTKCNVCDATLVTTKVWSCGHLSSSTTYGSHASISCSTCGGSGRISGTSTSYSLGCGLSTGYNCGYSSNDTNPICDRVVTSIAATSPIQTIHNGETLITTATATYLNGTTGTVICSVSGYNSGQAGNQVVTLTYSGLVGNAKTTGTRTCIINAEVILRNLVSIAVSPSNQSVTRYSQPLLTVTAQYDDASSEVLESGYLLNGFDNTKLGTQLVTVKYMENNITRTQNIEINVTVLTRLCPLCGTIYDLDENDTDQGCPVCAGTITSLSAAPEELKVTKGQGLDITVTATFRNGTKGIISGWTSNYNSSLIGYQSVKITYDGFVTVVLVNIVDNEICPICLTEYELNEDGSDPGCPICSKEIVSISASPKSITVNMNSELGITVLGTFKDGHTEEIPGWNTNYKTDKAGTYEAIIMYKGTTDIINVTVLDDSLITCPICGLAYNSADYPRGCPVCSVTLTGIEASLRNGGIQILYHSELNLEITLVFKDDHREKTHTGWEVEGFNPNLMGIQTITVRYGGLHTQLTIEVVENPYITRCSACGSEYYFNEDFSDPGCPYCGTSNSKNAIDYFKTIYTNEILDVLYKDKTYYLKSGEYITVKVTIAYTSVSAKLRNLFNIIRPEDRKKESYSYGGEVIL
ncbi:MAG: bacterial Ig-like domain-containing protein [Mobilitalea sp.]